MKNIFTFSNSEHRLKPFTEAIDARFSELDIPQHVREAAVAWAAQADSQYRTPVFDLSCVLPDGITDEQAEHLRMEIFREFKRYGEAIRAAKLDYIIEHVNQMLTEFLRTS